jgi:hypothetical protein
MLVNGTLKRAGLESFPTSSLPPAASFPYRVVFDETLKTLLVSDGVSWQTFGGTGAITFPTTVPTSPSGIVVGTSGIATYAKLLNKHTFNANGQYRVGNFVDGALLIDYPATIESIWVQNRVAGSSGITEVDIKVATTPGASFSSILSTSCFITSAAISDVWTDSGSVIPAQTGVTKPVLSVTSIPAGSAIRMDIVQRMVGARDLSVTIIYKEIP